EIKSVSDLAGKTIAIDDRQPGSNGIVRTAIVAAGAERVQLAESQTKPIDRVVDREVPAAVLTLVSREAAEEFPEIAVFNIFRIPLSPEVPQVEIADPRSAGAVAADIHKRTTQELVTAATALAERMTVAIADPLTAALAPPSDNDTRIAIVMA